MGSGCNGKNGRKRRGRRGRREDATGRKVEVGG